MLVAGCGVSPAPEAPVIPGPTQAAASAPRIAPPPVTPPTPPGSALPAFACADTTGGRTGVANVVAVRVSEQPGYDRFVMQFDSLVPSYTVKRQSRPVFALGPSGQTITLSGTAGVLLQVHSATGASTFTGPSDFTQAEYLVLKEARQTEDYEGYVDWGMGLGSPACLRSFTLSSPPRLVVDFALPAS